MTRKADAAERELRRRQVAANLLAGLNYREMADALGVSLGTVKNDVEAIIKRWQSEQVEATGDYLNLVERRLDRALNAIWDGVLSGDPKAIMAMLRIEERRAKLLGLDQPERIEHSGSVEQRRADPLEGLDDEARSKLIENLIHAREKRDAGRKHPGGGADR